jgi:phosphatidylinositol alpha 1,6-mannosyltransferase
MLRGLDLARAFASLDVFVHTGEAETFCQTVQEAQASGVPVVAPAAGGPLDLVDHGRTGLLFDPADKRSLRRSVATLVGDAALRESLAGRALGQVTHRGWADVVDDLVAVHYSAVLGGSPERMAA